MKTVNCISMFIAFATAAAGAQNGSAAPKTPGPTVRAAFASSKKPIVDLAKCGVDLTIENKGSNALLLNLGLMLGNGAKLLPTAISFDLQNANGKKIHLSYAGSQPGIAGRVDDFVVGLPPGASYRVRLSMSDFVQSGAYAPPALNGGSYVLTAVYDGASAGHVNTDMQGMSVMQFWQGTARSTGLPFKCAGSTAAPASGGG